MNTKRFGALSSSVDPDKLATTVTGLMKVIAGSLVYFGVVTQMDAGVLVTNLTTLMTMAFTAWGLLETSYGILRKIIVAVSAH